MKPFISISLCLLLLALVAKVVFAGSPLIISNTVIREAPPGLSVNAAYLSLENIGDKNITIDKVSSPVFARIEMHSTAIVEGVAKMQQQTELTVAAGETVILQAGGHHLMLLGAQQLLHHGDRVEMTLHTTVGDIQRIFFVKRF